MIDRAAPPDATADLERLRAELEQQRRSMLALYCLIWGQQTRVALPGWGREKRARLARTSERPSRARRAALAERHAGRPAAPPGRSEPALAIRCFGRFEVERQGQPVHQWRRSAAKTLLKYLVAQRQPVSRDALLELLWPETDPAVAANSFRVACHALRQVLGSDDYLVCDGRNYYLDPRAPIRVDVYAFAEHIDVAFRLERQRRPDEAAREYAAAVASYRDDYLVEDRGAEWTQLRREELKDHYLIALTRLADYYERRRDDASCIACCQKILTHDACREDAYQRLMRCHLRLGRRHQARHWFDVCVETLKRELDAAPSEETRRLLESIAKG
jgi:DNA-binding SARP family transcriptional activator